MLYAQVSLRIKEDSIPNIKDSNTWESFERSRGDVLFVITNDIFTINEKRLSLICEWEDDDLENDILITSDRRVRPYSFVEDILQEDGITYEEHTIFSDTYVDIDELDPSLLIRLLDPYQIVETLDWATIQPHVKRKVLI